MRERISNVQDALDTDGRTKALKLSVRWEDGVLILEGRVITYYQKQLAQHVVMEMGGIQFRNDINVRSRETVLV